MKQACAVLLTILLILPALPAGASQAATGGLSAEDLTAVAAVLIDADTGQVLYGKDMSRAMYPASTTKIMTGLLAMEHCDPMETATVNASAVDPIPYYTSHVALTYDEQLYVRDAMYALMLPSANDAANVLAEHVAGSQDAFVDMMNARARELGALDTHFANAHGLHDDDHYTTPYDLALITRAAYENGLVLQYMGTGRYVMPPTNMQPEARNFTNQQYMLLEDMWVYNPEVLGGKVGFTDEARWTMSTVARKNGRTLIAVVMQTGADEKFYDTQALLDYGFDQFTGYTMPGELLSGAEGDILYSSGDVQVLLPHTVSAQEVQIDIQIGDGAANAVLRLTQSVEGMPSELLRVPLQVEEDPSALAASAVLRLETGQGATFWGVARRILTVLLWALCIAVALLLLLVVRRTMVIRKRRRVRAARMRRLRGVR